MKTARREAECRERRLMSRYLDGELTAARCARFERHLKDCPSCAVIAGRLRLAIDACRKTRGPTLPAAVRRRARARMKALVR